MMLSSKLMVVVTVLLVSTACSTTRVTDDHTKHIAPDPFQEVNRKIYKFNTKADQLILRPIAKTYDKALPKPAKKGVSNFFSNLREPLNAVHNLLQGKYDRALSSGYRFAVNSTVGVLGLFDVAKKLDVQPAPEDFGQTLAAWGVKPGPYLMLPILGPSNVRDGIGRLSDSAIYYPFNEITDSSGGRTGLVFLDVVSFRASLLGTDSVLESQIDQYGFFKQAFEQTRIKAIYDGNPPQAPEEDFDDF